MPDKPLPEEPKPSSKAAGQRKTNWRYRNIPAEALTGPDAFIYGLHPIEIVGSRPEPTDSVSNNPCRYSVTRDYRLLDSAPVDDDKPPLQFDRATGQWKAFDGFVYLWREAIPVTAEVAAQYCRDGTIPQWVIDAIVNDTGLPPDPWDDDDEA